VLRSRIEEKVRQLNLANKVLFLGVRQDINLLLQGFDIFILPSLHEGLPVTLIEAQGSGLPCIISKEITTEVDMGVSLVHSLPLTRTEHWVEKIMEQVKLKKSRKIKGNLLSLKGYDIKNTARVMQESYLTLGEKRNEKINYIYSNV
ncbi:glycosyltransferase, partial [Bacillus sp. JJ1521]|uniref:glycosyltransferase n=1 Tax=Bacillus sp. JJ1521 TaxID=3122957 RepID=UPI002FFE85F0